MTAAQRDSLLVIVYAIAAVVIMTATLYVVVNCPPDQAAPWLRDVHIPTTRINPK